ncbi:MAG: LysR family transcriptional regulator [Alphaproteobacteria bacterium]|nr:LysR family transcriptional regulator [Alphaproteobacteria bacterium]
MDWDKLRIFHTVSQHKSLTRAGEVLSLSQSAVSRQISALEEKLGIALFHRHARGLMLSEQGEILFRTVSEMVSKLQATENALAEATSRPKGPFKLTVPSALGTTWIAQMMKEFTDLFPEIEVTLLCEDRELDLGLREADAAIRLYPAKSPDLVQKPIMTLHNALFASNDYLRLHGVPKSMAELAHHKLIGFESVGAPPFGDINWLFERPELRGQAVKPFFKVNSLLALRTAVKQGMGIALVPEYLMYKTRHVSRVLEDVEGPMTEAYFIYPMELKNSKRVGVFRNFLQQKIAESHF